MPASFDYAVIRVVPRVERQEFINAGVVVFCLEMRYLDARIHLDPARLKALWPEVDVDLSGNTWKPSSASAPATHPPADCKATPARALPLAGFRRSTILQPSPSIPVSARNRLILDRLEKELLTPER